MSTAAKTTTTYRALLRELPRRQLSASKTTFLHNRLRDQFRSPIAEGATTTANTSATAAEATEEETQRRLQIADQLAQYARAQRTYAMLVDRYNPGSNLTEEERIRLTARRVGFDLPVEAKKD